MPREKEHYRDNLMMLRERFGDVIQVPVKEAAPLLGVAVSTLKKDRKFPTKRIASRWFVPIAELASWLS